MVLRRRHERLNDVDVFFAAIRQQLNLQAVVAEAKRVRRRKRLSEFGTDVLGQMPMRTPGENDNLTHIFLLIHRVSENTEFPSGPQLTIKFLFGFVDRALIGSGRQVFPSPVAHDANNIGTNPRFDGLRGLSERGVQNRPRRDAGKDPFGLDELAYATNGIPWCAWL